MRKLTHEEFLNKFYEKNEHAQDIEILGTYINNRTKIRCRCKIDGYEWETKPNDLLNGHGCAKCGGTAKLTHEQFIQRLHQVNSNIQVLGTYKNNRTKIKCKCKVCGHEWETIPSVLLLNHGCPKCGFKRTKESRTKTHTQFMDEFYEKNTHAQDIEIMTTYINGDTKIKCKCKIDGYEWEATPNRLLNEHGCPKCGGTGKLTHEEFINRFHKQNTHAHDIEILGTYINYQTKIKCRCKICGHEWYTPALVLLMGSGCPKCNTSKGEKRIAQYLDNIGIDYIYDKQYFKDLVGTGGRLLRPDFIIASLKIWIEYDGIQHYEPIDFTGKMSAKEVQQRFEYTQQNDQRKNQYAKDNNWTLIRIPFTEYDNIEQILAEYIEQEEQVI